MELLKSGMDQQKSGMKRLISGFDKEKSEMYQLKERTLITNWPNELQNSLYSLKKE